MDRPNYCVVMLGQSTLCSLCGHCSSVRGGLWLWENHMLLSHCAIMLVIMIQPFWSLPYSPMCNSWDFRGGNSGQRRSGNYFNYFFTWNPATNLCRTGKTEFGWVSLGFSPKYCTTSPKTSLAVARSASSLVAKGSASKQNFFSALLDLFWRNSAKVCFMPWLICLASAASRSRDTGGGGERGREGEREREETVYKIQHNNYFKGSCLASPVRLYRKQT